MTDTAALVLPTDDPVILRIRERSAALKKEADDFVVDSPEARAAAVEVLSAIARVKGDAEDKRTGVVKPLNDHVKKVNELFREVMGPITEADTILRRKVTDYNREQQRIAQDAAAEAERLRLAAEAELRAAERAEAAKQPEVAATMLEKAVASEQQAAAVQQAAASAAPARLIKTDIGSASVRRRWTFKLIDISKVPGEFLQVNEQEIRKAIAGGVREIAGLEIFQTEDLAVRR